MASYNEGIMDRLGELEKCINELKVEVNSELNVLAVQIAENTEALRAIQKDFASTLTMEISRLLNLHKTSDCSLQHNTPHAKAMRYPSDEITSEHRQQIPGRAENPITVPDSGSPFQAQLASTSKDPSSYRRRKLNLWAPEDVDIPFVITSSLEFKHVEIAVIAYTFTTEKALAEKLVEFGTLDHSCSRQSLQSLAPSKYVATDVINALVCHLTHVEKETEMMNWFLPTSFAERVKRSSLSVEEGIKRYKTTFMSSKVKDCGKIFIPMVTKRTMKKVDHWFLVIVDMEKRRVFDVDSAAGTTDRQQTKIKRERIKEVLKYLQNLLAHPSFYLTDDHVPPPIAGFVIDNPERVPQQTDMWESSIWVMLWMKRLVASEDYDVGPADDFHRVNFLVDLLMSSYNDQKYELLDAAIKAFCAKELKEL